MPHYPLMIKQQAATGDLTVTHKKLKQAITLKTHGSPTQETRILHEHDLNHY